MLLEEALLLVDGLPPATLEGELKYSRDWWPSRPSMVAVWPWPTLNNPFMRLKTSQANHEATLSKHLHYALL